MPPLVSIVGKSKVGKTTMLEKLIPAMLQRGYRVGSIKHDTHDHFEMDVVGKDTWRHREAGAKTVAISSPSRLALTKIVDRELDLDAITAAYFQDEDLVFTEGYKSAKQPKIEICRSELQTEPLCTLQDRLVAVVSDFLIPMDVPRFQLDDVAGIADFIEERFLSNAA
jgi:molybdopterin-guanine dinucleotide biosynthesis protein B